MRLKRLQDVRTLHQLGQEAGDDEHHDADDEHGDGLLRAALPLLEDDAPDVGEHDVERHEDAERQRVHRATGLEERTAQRESEELAVPQGAGQQAEQQVVAPDGGLGVVAPRAVLLVLIETVDGIGDKSAERDEEGGRQGAEHRVGQVAEVDALAELQSDVEAAAHEACEQGDGQSLGEVEVLHGSLLLLLGERRGLHRACCSDDGDADECDHHAEDDGEGERLQCVELREEDVEQHGAENRAETSTGAEGYRLSEGHAEVAHGESERQAAHTPQHAEEDGHPDVERLLGGEQLTKAVPCRYCQQGA